MNPSASTLVLSMKDALREMRYSVRHDVSVIDRTPERVRRLVGTFLPHPETQALRMADALFGGLERAVALALRPLQGPGPFAALRSIGRLPPRHGIERTLPGNTFAEIYYHLSHEILRHLGIDNVLLSEQAFDAAGDMLEQRHSDLIAAVNNRSVANLSSDDREARVRLCAALACCLNLARPIRRIDPPREASSSRHLCLAPNLYCAALVGLTTAIVSTIPANPDLDATKAVDAANSVVDVRFSRMSAAIGARDPVTALTREFMAVIPYLP